MDKNMKALRCQRKAVQAAVFTGGNSMEPGAYMSAPPFPPPGYKRTSLGLAFLS